MRIGTVLRKWRLMSELDLRSAAAEIGLDHATLHRIEQGRMPSGESLRAILMWLMSNPRETQ